MPVQQMFDRRVSLRNDPAFVLAVLYTIGFFGVVFSLFLVTIPPDNKDTINQIMPILSAIQLGIVQYFYQKQAQTNRENADDTIKKLADTASTTAKTAAVAAGIPLKDIPAPADRELGQVEKADTINMSAETVNLNTEKGKEGDKQ